MDISHAEVSKAKPNLPTSPPSSIAQIPSSGSHHGSPGSKKPPLSLVKISGSNLQKPKVTSSVNMSTEDILRRLHRHPSIDTVKREMIEFQKGSGRMGIEVVAGDKTPHRGALVIRVFPDCIAGIEGKLRCGDEILEVNGRSIIGKSHAEVIGILKESTGLVTMLVSRSSQVLNSYSGSETSLLDDFYATERLKSANTPIQNSLDDLKSSANESLHSIRHEDLSEDELNDALPAEIVQQSSQGLSDDVITIQYSDSSIFSAGRRTGVIWEEEKLPPLPSSSPPANGSVSTDSLIALHITNNEIGLPLKDVETDGPPVGYSVVILDIQKVSKGKLTIVPCQKIREGYFMVSWLIQHVASHYSDAYR